MIAAILENIWKFVTFCHSFTLLQTEARFHYHKANMRVVSKVVAQLKAFKKIFKILRTKSDA